VIGLFARKVAGALVLATLAVLGVVATLISLLIEEINWRRV
jgi:hypothetical protein